MSIESRQAHGLIDPFGRTVDYVRVSVTDRCNLRCTYCMSEQMQFLPKAQLLTLEELDRVCTRLCPPGRAPSASDRRRAADAARHHGSGARPCRGI